MTRFFPPLFTKRISLFISVFLTLAVSNQLAWADKTLIHDARYTGEYKSINIVMARKLWQLSENEYKLETKAKNFLGSVVESEHFTWDKKRGIQPLQYHYEQKIFGIKKIRQIDFDWENQQALSTDKDKKATLELKPGTLGPLSYQLQMQLDLLRHPEVDADRTLEYTFVNRNKLKDYTFALDTELLNQKPELKDNVIVLTRTNEGSDKTTRLWLNPHDRFTLIKLEQIKEKSTHTLTFEKGSYRHPLDGTPYASALSPADSVEE